MKENMTFGCSHTDDVDLPDDPRARKEMRTHLQHSLCRTCRYNARVEEARAYAEQVGLVDLMGSPRQIAYGLLLRHQQLQLFLHELELAGRADPGNPRLEQWRQSLLSTVNRQCSATWWIEHQELTHLRDLLLMNRWLQDS